MKKYIKSYDSGIIKKHIDRTDHIDNESSTASVSKRDFMHNSIGLAFSLVIFFSLTLLVFSFFEYYPIPYFEKIVDPHMYYIKEFVHSLPFDVQTQMRLDAAALGVDIYEYNLQMCRYSPGYFEWWTDL